MVLPLGWFRSAKGSERDRRGWCFDSTGQMDGPECGWPAGEGQPGDSGRAETRELEVSQPWNSFSFYSAALRPYPGYLMSLSINAFLFNSF